VVRPESAARLGVVFETGGDFKMPDFIKTQKNTTVSGDHVLTAMPSEKQEA
jgi:hypothetical protein